MLLFRIWPMSCLIVCTNPRYVTLKSPGLWRFRIGLETPLTIPVPCGKCCECVKAKQNSVSARIYKEAQHCSQIFFVTLTYAPEYEPWAVSLWFHRNEDGKEVRLTEPVPIFHEGVVRDFQKFSRVPRYMVKDSQPRIFDQPIEFDGFRGFVSNERPQPFILKPKKFVGKYVKPSLKYKLDVPFTAFDGKVHNSFGYDYQFIEKNCNKDGFLFARYTPTLYMRDVRNVMMLWRVWYERKFKKKLPKFSYALVGEYGKLYTQRPHYHLVFIPKDKSNLLTKEDIEDFVSIWPYGRLKDLKVVNKTNKDHTDAFALLSRYLGKYISKGNFANIPEKLGANIRMRNCLSIRLGQCLSQKEIDMFTCQDIKRFNQDNALAELSQEDRKIILPEVAKRMMFTLVYKSDKNSSWSVSFKLPQALKKQIFNYRKSGWYDRNGNQPYMYSELYYMVQDFVRGRIEKDLDKQFREFCASWHGSPHDAVVAFEALQKEALRIREVTASEYMRAFYARCKE